jgi:FkbM family methyltransferase
MKTFDEWQLPDNEEHLQVWMKEVGDRQHGRLCYQGHKYRGAIQHCKERRVAIDVGAHVGLWSFMMAHDFKDVICFEPMPKHIDCWRENMKGIDNVTLIERALGEQEAAVGLTNYTENSSGNTRVSGDGNIPMQRLDYYELQNVDFLKIDCEGYELFVLKGAEETLKRCKPVVIVEQKGTMSLEYGLPRLAAVEYLKSLGARHISDVGGDYILGWE